MAALLVVRLAVPERKERVARDAERGIIQCAVRYPNSQPGSLRSRWLPGLAEVSRGAVRFQPDFGAEGRPAGAIRTFSDVILEGPVQPPAKRPPELKWGRSFIALETDERPLHVAAGDTGLKLLEDRLGDHET
ncbi:hypothetical protein QFZ23_002201 [Arthrobacter globiformis]|nr:hypothetical protein [Arthrobacter globiformis]